MGESRSRIDIYHDGKGAFPIVARLLLKGREVDAPTTIRQPREVVLRGFVGETAESEVQVLTRENRDARPWIEALESDTVGVSVQLLGIDKSPGPTQNTIDRTYDYRVTAALNRRGRLPLAVLTAHCATPTGGVGPTTIRDLNHRATSRLYPAHTNRSGS